jgi:KTSC domain
MNLIQVKSSNLAAVGYDKESRTLRILFQEGAMYDYYAVPSTIHDELMKSGSKGEFFQQHIIGKFKYAKVNTNLREEGKTTMGKNKQQIATESRAKKSDNVQPAEQPKAVAAPAAATQPAVASKQMATIETLKAGWLAKGVNLDKLTVTPDGKFQVLIVAEGWPRVTIGPTGGIVVTDLKSYAKAFDAAMDGLNLFQKQQAREAKKATTATAPPAAPAEVKTKAA